MIISFTGLRPSNLYGYDYSTIEYANLNSVTKQVCRMLITNCETREFISGGALGFDTIAFRIIEELKEEFKGIYKITNTLAIPFRQQGKVWRDESVRVYEEMKSLADKVIYVDECEGYMKSIYDIGEYKPYKMELRNRYMIDNSDCLVCAWYHPSKGGTYNARKYAKSLGKPIITIDVNNYSVTKEL